MELEQTCLRLSPFFSVLMKCELACCCSHVLIYELCFKTTTLYIADMFTSAVSFFNSYQYQVCAPMSTFRFYFYFDGSLKACNRSVYTNHVCSFVINTGFIRCAAMYRLWDDIVNTSKKISLIIADIIPIMVSRIRVIFTKMTAYCMRFFELL